MKNVNINEVADALQDFIDARKIKVNNEYVLPVDKNTVHKFILELCTEREELDDFRSRA